MNQLVKLRCDRTGRDQEIVDYSLGAIDDAKRADFEVHLLACPVCLDEVTRLAPVAALIQQDESLAMEVLRGKRIRGVWPAARESVPVYAATGLFALLCSLTVLAETAYLFDRRPLLPGALAILALPAGAAASFFAFYLNARQTAAGARGLVAGSAAHLALPFAMFLVALLTLPNQPLVPAAFQTMPAPVGLLKTSLYNAIGAITFLMLPFHAIVALRSEVASGRHTEVLAFLSSDSTAVAPPGAVVPSVTALGAVLLVATAGGTYGVSHLLDALQPGPGTSLFTFLVIVRFSTWLLVAVVGWYWYARALNEIKRQCRVMVAVGKGGS